MCFNYDSLGFYAVIQNIFWDSIFVTNRANIYAIARVSEPSSFGAALAPVDYFFKLFRPVNEMSEIIFKFCILVHTFYFIYYSLFSVSK